jgi:cytochrome c
MRKGAVLAAVGVAMAVLAVNRTSAAEGNPERGGQAFELCAPCHSVEKGIHLTGPGLAKIWGRKAGTIKGFRRYSMALKSAGVVWNEKTLDKWLRDPKALIPGNGMIFLGVADGGKRADLIAFLKQVFEKGLATARTRQRGRIGPRPVNLKEIEPGNQVKRITYCADSYTVTTASGDTHRFWEFNLRFKSDSSENGPPRETPAILSGGTKGDRAYIVFASPEQISPFIERRCE